MYCHYIAVRLPDKLNPDYYEFFFDKNDKDTKEYIREELRTFLKTDNFEFSVYNVTRVSFLLRRSDHP